MSQSRVFHIRVNLTGDKIKDDQQYQKFVNYEKERLLKYLVIGEIEHKTSTYQAHYHVGISLQSAAYADTLKRSLIIDWEKKVRGTDLISGGDYYCEKKLDKKISSKTGLSYLISDFAFVKYIIKFGKRFEFGNLPKDPSKPDVEPKRKGKTDEEKEADRVKKLTDKDQYIREVLKVFQEEGESAVIEKYPAFYMRDKAWTTIKTKFGSQRDAKNTVEDKCALWIWSYGSGTYKSWIFQMLLYP